MAKADDDSDSGSDHEGEGSLGHSRQQQQRFRAGTVARVHRDGTFLVEYASGQAEKHVPLGRLYQEGSAAAAALTSSSSSSSIGGAGKGANYTSGGTSGIDVPCQQQEPAQNGMKKPMLTRMGRWVGKAVGLIQRSERSRSRSKSQDKYAAASSGNAIAGAGGSQTRSGGDSSGGGNDSGSSGGGMLLTAEGLKQHTATAASLHRMSVTTPAVTSAAPTPAAGNGSGSSQPPAPAPPPETLRRRPKAGRAAFMGAATTVPSTAGATSGAAAGGRATTGAAPNSSGIGSESTSLTGAEAEAEFVRGCALLEVSHDAAAAAEAFEVASAAGHFQATTKLGLLFAHGHKGDASE